MTESESAEVNLVSSSGSQSVDSAIGTLIGHIQARFPDAELGFYLHGSWESSTPNPASDVDILALATTAISNKEHQEARTIASQIVEASGVPLDFHLHPVQALIENPYVDLRRTGRFLFGVDHRQAFPEPSLDALARESVLCVCLFVSGWRDHGHPNWPFSHPKSNDEFFGRLLRRNPPGLGKKLNWFASALLCGRHGYSPVNAADALSQLTVRGDAWGEWLSNAGRVCSSVQCDEQDSAKRRELIEVCERTLDLENETVAALLSAHEAEQLGPKCGELLHKYIDVTSFG